MGSTDDAPPGFAFVDCDGDGCDRRILTNVPDDVDACSTCRTGRGDVD